MNQSKRLSIHTPLAVVAALMLVVITLSSASIRISGDELQDKSAGLNVLGVGNDLSGPETGAIYEEVTVGYSDTAPMRGDLNTTKFFIIEFSDYESPHSYRFFTESYYEILEKYVATGDAVYQIRDFPLDFHPFARKAAVAARCAGEQGGDNALVEYHDRLYKNWPLQSDDEYFAMIASNMSLSADALVQCLSSNSYNDLIDEDIAFAKLNGINSSPSFIVGQYNNEGQIEGYKISGSIPLTEFEGVINSLRL